MGTGGLLNVLNDRMKISSVKNSVPVMKLIKNHNPISHRELYDLIEYHHTHKCPCGVRSKGSVYDFGKNLYDAQLEFWGEYKFSLDECIQWEYDLFIVNSLKGASMENKALSALSDVLPDFYSVDVVSNRVDVDFRVDLEIRWFGFLLLGVQVKPFSYCFMEDEVTVVNSCLNERFPVEVRYLFYDEDGVFINLDEIVGGLIP